MSDKPIVTIIGAGRSGRGMLGEMFYQEKNYSIVFADIDTGLVQGLAEQGYYTVEQKNLLTGKSRESIVKGFQIVDTVNDHLKYITYLARSEMIATALFPSAFDQVAEDLAEMIRMRKEQKNDSTAAIILGGNFVGLRQYFDKKSPDLWMRMSWIISKTYCADNGQGKPQGGLSGGLPERSVFSGRGR